MRYSIMGATVQQVRSIGGADIKTTRSVNIIFANLTTEQVAQLKAQGALVTKIGRTKAAVMPPQPVEAAPVYTAQELAWAAGFEELRFLISPPLYGSGFNLAIIDSGIRETHELTNGRVVYSKNFTSSPMRDGLNHGTGVCSIALTVAPLCNILNLKVLDDEGVGTEEEVVLAIDDCIAMHDTQPDIAPLVINLSLGSPDTGDPDNIIRVVCREAIGRGIWVVAAAGNDGPEPMTILCPACDEYVDAIGSASYEPFKVSDFSSRGPTKEGLIKPDELMFGENVIVASSESDTATIPKSGTSFSAPFISGITILYEELISVPAVREQFKQVLLLYGYSEEIVEEITPEMLSPYLPLVCVKPQGVPAGKDNDYGYGLYFAPQLLRVLGLTKPAVDISAVITAMTTVVGVGLMGMMMVPMAGVMKSVI